MTEENNECCVCLETYNDTNIIKMKTKCGHDICKTCLNGTEKYGCVKCPLCRFEYKKEVEYQSIRKCQFICGNKRVDCNKAVNLVLRHFMKNSEWETLTEKIKITINKDDARSLTALQLNDLKEKNIHFDFQQKNTFEFNRDRDMIDLLQTDEQFRAGQDVQNSLVWNRENLVTRTQNKKMKVVIHTIVPRSTINGFRAGYGFSYEIFESM